jgi:hypothetical protein
MKKAVKLMAVSAKADEYQYKKTSPFLKYDPMKIRNEKTKKIIAAPRTTCRKNVGPTPWMKKGGITPNRLATANKAIRTVNPT